jgi:hypothetical protein
MGRSRGGLTSKVHVVVDANGLRVGQHTADEKSHERHQLQPRSLPLTQPGRAVRRIATRYDKLAANYLAFIKLASIRLWIRAYESTP